MLRRVWWLGVCDVFVMLSTTREGTERNWTFPRSWTLATVVADAGKTHRALGLVPEPLPRARHSRPNTRGGHVVVVDSNLPREGQRVKGEHWCWRRREGANDNDDDGHPCSGRWRRPRGRNGCSSFVVCDRDTRTTRCGEDVRRRRSHCHR